MQEERWERHVETYILRYMSSFGSFTGVSFDVDPIFPPAVLVIASKTCCDTIGIDACARRSGSSL